MSGDWTIDIGRYDPYGEVELPIPGWKGAHWLVGGSTGSGKTKTIQLVIAKLMIKYGDQIAYAFCDPDFVNYKSLTPRASVIGFGDESALPLLTLVEREMVRRFKLMWELDIEEWTPEVADKIGPYLILGIEEFKAISSLPNPPAPKPGMKAPKGPVARVTTLAQRMRKTGGGLIIATQFPNVKTIPNDILAQCAIRWCGRTQEPEQTEAILGSRRFPCHDPEHPKGIPVSMQGGAYLNNGTTTRRMRSDGIKPETFAALARKYSADRTDFGWPHQLLPEDLASAKEG